MGMKCLFGVHEWGRDCEKCSACGRERFGFHYWKDGKCTKCGTARHELGSWKSPKSGKAGAADFTAKHSGIEGLRHAPIAPAPAAAPLMQEPAQEVSPNPNLIALKVPIISGATQQDSVSPAISIKDAPVIKVQPGFNAITTNASIINASVQKDTASPIIRLSQEDVLEILPISDLIEDGASMAENSTRKDTTQNPFASCAPAAIQSQETDKSCNGAIKLYDPTPHETTSPHVALSTSGTVTEKTQPEFRCPHCQKTFQVGEEQRGTDIPCPSCNVSVRVPLDAGSFGGEAELIWLVGIGILSFAAYIVSRIASFPTALIYATGAVACVFALPLGLIVISGILSILLQIFTPGGGSAIPLFPFELGVDGLSSAQVLEFKANPRMHRFTKVYVWLAVNSLVGAAVTVVAFAGLYALMEFARQSHH